MFNIPEELKKLPDKPGVYIMKDKNDTILYVGKAVVLKNRVRQYFQKTPKSPRIEKMVSQIDHFEYIVVDSEMEALILECNLIKLHRPKYNVLLKDDKMYPYIKVALNETYPTVRITRKKLNDGAKYYGPYTNAYAAKETVDFLNKTFRLKYCKKAFKEDKLESPCLNYHIKRCTAPCAGLISKEEYQNLIKKVMLLLDGKVEPIVKLMEEEMKKASEEMNFEKAADLRDKIYSIQNIAEKQKIDNYAENDMDVIGIEKALDRASVEVFHIRGSKMIGGDNFILKNTEDLSEEELVASFMKQYYHDSNVPSKIMLKYHLEEEDLLRNWLVSISGRSHVELKVPKIGDKMRLIEMAEQNAHIGLQNKTDTIENEGLLLELKELLNLKEIPKRIESYDISNIAGTDTVAGIVVFENAKPKKNEYRKIKIKTVEGQNDVASMREVLLRRLKYLLPEYQNEKNPFGPMPQLILMDGGITEVRVAVNVVLEYGFSIPVYGLVKNDKHRTRAVVDASGTEYEVESDELFQFLTFIQDEVHDTAISYHRKVRDAKMKKSILDQIDGIGEKKKALLLQKFHSIENIRKATVEELCEVLGIHEELAQKILSYLSLSKQDERINDR